MQYKKRLSGRGSTGSPTVVRQGSPTMVRLSSPTVVRQAHQPWFDRLTNRGSTKLTNHPTMTQCLFFTAFLPNNNKPMEGRLSNPEICIANLRYPEKSMDFSFLICITEPWMDFSGSYARLEGWRSQTAGGGPERQRSPGKRVTKGASGRISQKVVW